ncbi:MAG: NACHT domain-containing protein [Acidobacteria bacterium]|nr:NACHT domain-containing protein [Acidobacteriota bacterium]
MPLGLSAATIDSLVVNVVSSAIWAFMARAGGLVKSVEDIVCPPPSHLSETVAAALGDSTWLRNNQLFPRESRLKKFLESPEVVGIASSVFATASTIPAASRSYAQAALALKTSLARFMDTKEELVAEIADQYLNALVACVEASLRNAIEKGCLPAHEAMSAARHNELYAQIRNLERVVILLAEKSDLDVAKILEFEEKYRDQVGKRQSRLRPAHLDSGRTVHIDELFVQPRLSEKKRMPSAGPKAVELSDLLAVLNRSVVLGNPGGGKSTLAAKVCCDLSSQYSSARVSGRGVTPSVVVLRDYGTELKKDRCSIVDFMERDCESSYQLKPPPHAFEYLLTAGRLMVIFDGLDELLDTSFRREVTANVESFCNLYASVPVLVTSRVVGYDQAPLPEEVFACYELAPFDASQVSNYSKKWFCFVEEDEKRGKELAASFLAESESVADLRSNPLLLGLMCNLYRSEKYIPQNRPDLYEKCAVMLFERWDRSRGIKKQLPFEAHLRPAMEDLAFWIYSDDNLRSGVHEEKLVDRATSFLLMHRFDDPIEAKAGAKEFVEYCTGRAWVFSDVGTDPNGERIFQFTHRTFLEYFAAQHLVSLNPTPDRLLAVLRPRIIRKEWDVVVQLAFQRQSKQVLGAADQLLLDLIPSSGEPLSNRLNIASFVASSLKFLVPSPKARPAIVEYCLQTWCECILSRESSDHETVLGHLLTVHEENREAVARGIEKCCSTSFLNGPESEQHLWALLAFDVLAPFMGQLNVDANVKAYWREFSRRAIEQFKVEILRIGMGKPIIMMHSLHQGLVSVKECVKQHGISFILSMYRFQHWGAFFSPLGMAYVIAYLSKRESSESQEYELALEQLEECLATTPPPWHPGKRFLHEFGQHRFVAYGEESLLPPPEASKAAVSAALVLLAVEEELRGGDETLPVGGPMKLIPADWSTILSGPSQPEKHFALAALDRVMSTSRLKPLMEDWIRGKVKLVSLPGGDTPLDATSSA